MAIKDDSATTVLEVGASFTVLENAVHKGCSEFGWTPSANTEEGCTAVDEETKY